MRDLRDDLAQRARGLGAPLGTDLHPEGSVKKDPVTPEVRAAVIKRDGYRCVGPALARMAGIERAHVPCVNTWGSAMDHGSFYLFNDLQIDHVRDGPGGPRRSSERWLQTVCPGCHLGGFIGRKDVRAAARERLERLYGEEPDGDTAY